MSILLFDMPLGIVNTVGKALPYKQTRQYTPKIVIEQDLIKSIWVWGRGAGFFFVVEILTSAMKTKMMYGKTTNNYRQPLWV